MIKGTAAIRFRGFTDDWEQRKFSELYARSSEKNDGSIGMDKNITVATMQFKNDVKVSTTEYLKTYYTFKLGDIAFEGHQSKEFRYGRFIENDIGNGIVSHIFAVFRPIQEYDLYFWKYAINNETLMQRILARSTKASTMMHDLVTNDFLNETFLVPSVKEQKQIGAFLYKLDNLITLHQRKLEQQKKLKKYFLQNIFPAKGENVPRIRFKGFTGDWEQWKLGDIYGTITNAFVGIATPYYVDEGHFYLESNNVKNGSINKNTQVYINDEFYYKQKDKWLHTGDIVMVQSGHVGHSAVIPESLDKIAAHALIMFQNQKVETNPYFLNAEYQTDRAKKQINNISKGNTIKHILASDMKKFTVMVPSLKEQQKISDFFTKLDDLITLHQRKIDQLQAMKQFMLQNMFI